MGYSTRLICIILDFRTVRIYRGALNIVARRGRWLRLNVEIALDVASSHAVGAVAAAHQLAGIAAGPGTWVGVTIAALVAFAVGADRFAAAPVEVAVTIIVALVAVPARSGRNQKTLKAVFRCVGD